MGAIITRLLENGDPALRYKLLVRASGIPEDSREALEAQETVRRSATVQALLSERDENGHLPYHPYKKWEGAHWTLAQLADLGYPPGDESLFPLREQVCEWLLPGWRNKPSDPYRKKLVLEQRVRTCASQEGNALYALLALGLADERTDLLAQGLLSWQWPDGGWNCDKHPSASHSSFHETLTPMRGLIQYARVTGKPEARAAAERAADVFLRRRLFRRLANREVMQPYFIQTHYPPYWHYDFLFGLKVMAEGGWVCDERCREALDLLESKRLTDGGFPLEGTWFKLAKEGQLKRGHAAHWTLSGVGLSRPSLTSLVDWGRPSAAQSSPWVTADALLVLHAVGRI